MSITPGRSWRWEVVQASSGTNEPRTGPIAKAPLQRSSVRPCVLRGAQATP